jgi:hypothetical protein
MAALPLAAAAALMMNRWWHQSCQAQAMGAVAAAFDAMGGASEAAEVPTSSGGADSATTAEQWDAGLLPKSSFLYGLD